MKNKFELGDLVSWESQSNGSTTVKCGTIINVIPVGVRPRRGFFTSTHRVLFDGCKRDHESYLVEMPHSGNGKPILYHPRVSQLKKEKV